MQQLSFLLLMIEMLMSQETVLRDDIRPDQLNISLNSQW